MNPVSTDIKDILVAELGFEFGVDLFISQQPTTPMNCVTIFDTSSTPPNGTVDGDNVFMYETIMFWVRNSSYEAAYLQAQSIIGTLHNKRKFVQNETFYLRVNLQNGPNTLTGDAGEGDYSEFSMNFNVLRKSGIEEPSAFLTFVDLVAALVAGTNVTLSVDTVLEKITINSTGGMTSVSWGDIEGNIEDQADLIAYIVSQVHGSGGFIAPVYFTTLNSDIATYKKLSYSPEADLTELSGTVNSSEGDKLFRTYIYDEVLSTTILDAGQYVARAMAKLDSKNRETKLIFEVFVRETEGIDAGTETTLFTSVSEDINSTSYTEINQAVQKSRFTLDSSTQRFGVRIKARTTSVSDITITTKVGGEDAAYFSTPIALRHSLLRNPNEAPDVQHLTAAEKALLKTTTITEITISVADWAGGTTVTKAVPGVLPDPLSEVKFSMSYATGLIWGAAGCWGESQDTDEITIVCTTTPTQAMTIKVLNTK